MVATKDFFQLAQLAEASYAIFDDFPTDPKRALIEEGYSDKQAENFLDTWQLVPGAHRPNTASGFSSTLFQDKHDTAKYVLAFRGTEPLNLGDLAADIGDIAADGIAIDQIVDLYNEWRRISKASYHAAYLETLTAETAAYAQADLFNTGVKIGDDKTDDREALHLMEMKEAA